MKKIHLSEFFLSLSRIEDKSLSQVSSKRDNNQPTDDDLFLSEIFIVDLNVGVKNIVSLCGLISLKLQASEWVSLHRAF